MFRFLLFYFLSFSLLPSDSWGMSRTSTPKNPFLGKEEWSLSQFSKKHPDALEAKIYFISNQEGQVGTCGCSVNPKGGLDRMSAFSKIEKLPQELSFNTGNAFFPNLVYPEKDLSLYQKNSQKIAQAYQNMGLDAHNVGELDLAFGIPYLKELQKKYSLNFVSANIADASGALIFKPFLRVKLGDKSLVVTGLSSFNQFQDSKVRSLNPITSIQSVISEVKKFETLVVLSDLSSLENEKLATLYAEPFIVLGAKEIGSQEVPEQEKKALFWQLQNRGQQWGVLRWAHKRKAQKWYSSQKAQEFARRWQQLSGEHQRILNLKASSDRASELDLLEQKFYQLSKFAPSSGYDKNIFYEYSLVDMDEKYAQ